MAEDFEKREGIENTEGTEEEDFLIDLFDEDGNQKTFEHLDTVQVDGCDYVICIPYKEEDDGETDEVVILKMEQDENEEYILVPEEDLEILDRAYELLKDRNLDLFEFED